MPDNNNPYSMPLVAVQDVSQYQGHFEEEDLVDAYRIKFPWRGQGFVGWWRIKILDNEVLMTGMYLKKYRMSIAWWLAVLSLGVAPAIFPLLLCTFPLLVLGLISARAWWSTTQKPHYLIVSLEGLEHFSVSLQSPGKWQVLVKLRDDFEFQVGFVFDESIASKLLAELSEHRQIMEDQSGSSFSGAVRSSSEVIGLDSVVLPPSSPKSYRIVIRIVYLSTILSLLAALIGALTDNI